MYAPYAPLMQTRPIGPVLLVLLLSACPSRKASRPKAPPAGVATAIRQSLAMPGPVAGQVPLGSAEVLARAYAAREHRPAWLDGACPSGAAGELIGALMASGDYGLSPADFPLDALGRLQSEARLEGCKKGTWPVARAAALELLLSDAFALFAAQLSQGRLNQGDLSPRRSAWPESDAEAALGRALSSGRAVAELRLLGPRAAPYENLVASNRMLRRAAEGGGFPGIPDGPTARVGDHGPRVEALRRRLKTAGYPVDGHGERFSRAVQVSLEVYQERAGLPETGELDALTLAHLNTPVDRHLDTIALNLERWRWLPRALGDPAVVVNIPGQRVHLLARGGAGMTMKAVVGRRSRPTPQLSSTINMMVINPTWYVPDLIATEDILPMADRNPGYLEARGFRWVETGDHGGWGAAGASRLVQLPGRHNALGRLKLVFPNKHDVYLHDTSSPQLFQRRRRFLSSGCVRLERAEALAAELLRRSNGWSGQKIEASLAGGGQKRLTLARPVAVHLVYFTAWARRPGHLRSYDDVYELNGELASARGAAPAAPVDSRQ